MGIKNNERTWKIFARAIDANRFHADLKEELSKVAGKVGMLAVRHVRQTIAGYGFTPNAELTVVLKGSNEPLKGTKGAELWNSVTYKVLSWNTVFVGVLRNSDQYNVALAVHNGSVIPVTDKMRGMFYYLWKASLKESDESGKTGVDWLTSDRARFLFEQYQDWKPLKASTTTIIIPERPFFDVAFSVKTFQDRIKKYWRGAIIRALKA